jgi:hypothetical protein
MTKFVNTFNGVSELRAELNRLETLADIKGQQIDANIQEIKGHTKPIITVFNLITGRKSLNYYGFYTGAALIKGLKIAIPYILPKILTGGSKKGFMGALTAVGGELLIKNLKNIDTSQITARIMELFNKKTNPTEEYNKNKYYTSEE